MTDFWASVLPSVPLAYCQPRVRQIFEESDARRIRADYNTGSITKDEIRMLWALAERFRARVVLEVGTFIGTSALALAMGSSVEAVYTCDSSNDCLDATAIIRTYPKTASQDMWLDLRARNVVADLCFFDGVLRDVDAAALKGLTNQQTIFAFHDYNHGPKLRKHGVAIMPMKGIGNVNLLRPMFPKHVLIDPPAGTTLAVMVPEGRL
jgi:hypothetical protein